MRQQRQNSLSMTETEGSSPSHSEDKQELTIKKFFSRAKPRKSSLYVSTLKNQALSLTPKASSRDNREKVLVLDLDHTLMCNFRQGESQVKGKSCPLKIKGSLYQFTVVKRPGLEKFLYEVSKHYRLMIYTTSLEEYAIGVLKVLGILPLFEKIFHRDNCIQQSDGNWLKDLKCIGEPLEKLVFLDDSIKQVNSNPLNAMPIVPFQGDLRDNQLLKLIPVLVHLAEKRDVRPVYHRYQKYCLQERKAKSEKKSNKLDVNTKMPRATSCSPAAKRYCVPIVETEQLNQSTDYEISDNGATMPSIRMFEPKLLVGSPILDEKVNSFTDLFNQRVREQEINVEDKEDDPENAVFMEDEEDCLRDTTPRLMSNFSNKSPMHRKRQK